MVLMGRVRGADGRALAGALLDLWQADGEGRYSQVDAQVPPYALRARVVADGEGAFAVRTVVPGPESLDVEGALREFLQALGRPLCRPAHVHLTVSHPGYRTLTTQVYFPGDPYDETELLGRHALDLQAMVDDGPPGRQARFDVVLSPGAPP